MRSLCLGLFVGMAVAVATRAQSTVPTLTQAVPSHTFSPGGPAATIDLRNHFSVPGVVGTQFAQFDTVLGSFNVELRADAAPQHVANFLAYVQDGTYANTFIHRSASFDNGAVSIVQGGGYGFRVPLEVFPVTKRPPVPLEYNLPNARGTLAAARSADLNSATSEWYFNVRDNTTILNQSNGGGYTVFGRVLGTGMTVVDAIAAIRRYDAGSPLNELPLRDYTSGTPTQANLVVVNSVRAATLFPTGSGVSVMALEVQNSAPAVVAATISGSTLMLTPLAAGTADVTVRAFDANGNGAETSFTVTVAPVAAGSTIVLHAPSVAGATYRWERDGVPVNGATGSVLVLNNISAAEQGTYRAFATGPNGSAVGDPIVINVTNVEPSAVSRLVNLSILTAAGAGDRILTMGAAVGGGDGGTLSLVVRAIGPTLGQPPFGVGGVLADPVMTLYSLSGGQSVPLESNDNWGGSAALSAAFTSVGAFMLPTASADSAMFRGAPGVAAGNYSVQVSGKGDAMGNVLAEVYDAGGTDRPASVPRLINLSTLALIDAGSDLAVGFVIGGQTARTVLVRGAGPSLASFNITGMPDPRLELFNNDTRQRVASNDDWGGSDELANVGTSVGAFPLISRTSKDAVVVVTLPPGAYSARVSGVGNTGGAAIVEIYEVP